MEAEGHLYGVSKGEEGDIIRVVGFFWDSRAAGKGMLVMLESATVSL